MSIPTIVEEVVDKAGAWLSQTGKPEAMAAAAAATSVAEEVTAGAEIKAQKAATWVIPDAQAMGKEVVQEAYDASEWFLNKAEGAVEAGASILATSAETVAESVIEKIVEHFEGNAAAAVPASNATIPNAIISCMMAAGVPANCTDAQGNSVAAVIAGETMYFIEAEAAAAPAANVTEAAV